MALVSLDTYNSIPNIDAKNNNFRYSPDNGTTWIDINIPEGSYEIDNIEEYVQRIMRNNGHYDTSNNSDYITIDPNNNTMRLELNMKAATYKVDFTTANSVRTVLGFNSQIFSQGYHESESTVNIMPVNSINVTSDIIGA